MGLFNSKKKDNRTQQEIDEDEEVRQQSTDPNEGQKYVCMGGKVSCDYCTPPEAQIIVTSTTIKLQDKPWATVDDKDGKVNFLFMGQCTHPSQQKPFMSPPPCKAIISLGRWTDYSETKVDGKNALLMKSKIKCMISGEDITITDCGQKASPSMGNEKQSTKNSQEKISQQWILPKLFAVSDRKPGKSAKDENVIAEDMLYGDKTMQDIIPLENTFSVAHNESDDFHFRQMYGLFIKGSLFGGIDNSTALVAHFRENTGTDFQSFSMNKALAEHPSLQKFLYDEKGVIPILCEALRKENGNINNFDPKNPLKGKINSTRVKFNTLSDMLTGMTIAVDDTWAYKVYIEKYELLSANMFNATLRIDIYDHFGLDAEDIKNHSQQGFISWYILQHVKGYKPFLTKMVCTHTIKNKTF